MTGPNPRFWTRQTKPVFAVLAIVIFGLTGAAILHNSLASTVIASGRVYDSRTNQGFAGVTIDTCNGTTTTDGNGNWQFNINVGGLYCARIVAGAPVGLPSPTTNNRPEHATSTSYEEQVPAQNCYHDSSCSVPSQTWDRSTDSNVSFIYT